MINVFCFFSHIVSFYRFCYSYFGDMFMKKKYLNLMAVGALVFFFLISMVFPSLKNIMKLLALAVYGGVNFLYIKQKKQQGEEMEKDVLFIIAVLVIFAYLFYA